MKLPKRYVKFLKRVRKNPKKYVLPALGLFVVMHFALTSITFATYYNNRSLPNLYIASVEVGNMPIEDIQTQMSAKLDATKLSFMLEDKQFSASASELGLSVDDDYLRELAESRNITQWLIPLVAARKENLPLVFEQDGAKEFFKQFKSQDFKDPISASFVVEGDKIVIKEHKNGIGIDSTAAIDEAISSLAQDLTDKNITLETTELKPDILTTDIENARESINSKLAVAHGFTADDKTTALTKAQIGSLLKVQKAMDGSIQIIVDKKSVEELVGGLAKSLETKPITKVTNKYLSGKSDTVETEGKNGRKITNTAILIDELIAKIDSNQPHNIVFAFEDIPFESTTVGVDDVTITATYTYDVQVWGAVGSDLASFKASAAETLASAIGWAGAGISFAEVTSGGSFTLVLASPDSVAAASSGCSAEYSCRVGRFVIINDQRWQGATSSWNSAGGSLRDYRHMVVNHEVGHWLGFGHRICPGAGQLAPVMLQQSISLQGCKFNPWPTQAELGSI